MCRGRRINHLAFGRVADSHKKPPNKNSRDASTAFARPWSINLRALTYRAPTERNFSLHRSL
jgi:hypothetical protein